MSTGYKSGTLARLPRSTPNSISTRRNSIYFGIKDIALIISLKIRPVRRRLFVCKSPAGRVRVEEEDGRICRKLKDFLAFRSTNSTPVTHAVSIRYAHTQRLWATRIFGKDRSGSVRYNLAA